MMYTEARLNKYINKFTSLSTYILAYSIHVNWLVKAVESVAYDISQNKFERFKFVLPLNLKSESEICEYENFFPEKKAVIDLSFKLSYRSIRLWTIHMKETQLW